MAVSTVLLLGGCFATQDDIISFDRSDVPPTAPGVYDCTGKAGNAFGGAYTFDVFHGQNGQPEYIISHRNTLTGQIAINRVSFARVSDDLYVMAIQEPITENTSAEKRQSRFDISDKAGRLPRHAPENLLITRIEKNTLMVLDTNSGEGDNLSETEREAATKKLVEFGKSYDVKVIESKTGFGLDGSALDVQGFLQAFARAHDHAPILLTCNRHADSNAG